MSDRQTDKKAPEIHHITEIEREMQSEWEEREQDYRCICNSQSKNEYMDSVSLCILTAKWLSLLPAIPVYKVAS